MQLRMERCFPTNQEISYPEGALAPHRSARSFSRGTANFNGMFLPNVHLLHDLRYCAGIPLMHRIDARENDILVRRGHPAHNVRVHFLQFPFLSAHTWFSR
jgi:hypothetical protein